MKVTEYRLNELMRLHEKATEGPWKIESNHTAYDGWGDSVCSTQQTHNQDNNLEYIVSACNSLPDLIKYIHELEERIKFLNTLNERKWITRVFTTSI